MAVPREARRPTLAIDDQSFSYRLTKISLVILNALVIVGLTFSLLMIGHHFDTSLIIFVLIIESNFIIAIVGALRESRPLVVTSGSVTLIILLLAVFNRTERTQHSTFSMLYFLAIVLLSYTFSAMLKEREHSRLMAVRGRPQHTMAEASSSVPFTTVVVYSSTNQNATPSQVAPTGEDMVANGFKDPPPPYDDCPPPKYEDVAKQNNGPIV